MPKLIFTVVVLGTFGSTLFAQQPKNPVMDTVRHIFERQQKNLTAAAEEMPADKYSYHPTPPQMSFGKLVMHIAESNDFLCARIADAEPQKVELKETDGKDKLVSALKKSFDYCGGVLAKVDDSKLGSEVKLFGGRTAPKAAAAISLTNDWADHYAAAAIYLRLNGLLPPTAQKKGE
jgi:hypothetical protein